MITLESYVKDKVWLIYEEDKYIFKINYRSLKDDRYFQKMVNRVQTP